MSSVKLVEEPMQHNGKQCVTQTGEGKYVNFNQYFQNIYVMLTTLFSFCFGTYNLLLKEMDMW